MRFTTTSSLKFFGLGMVFALFWSSAAAAAKFGLHYAEPLVLYQFRFFLAGIGLLLIATLGQRSRLPRGQEWKHLAIFGFLNVTVYLGLFVLGIKEVAAGIGSLALALNPLLMALMLSFLQGKRIRQTQIITLILGLIGVGIALFPLFGQSYATPKGVALLGASMVSYSVAATFYARIPWTLNRLAINGWQVLFGGIFLLPLTLYFHQTPTQYTPTFWASVLWNAFPVSGLAVYLWLWLLQQDAVRASYFLYICPIFGLIYSSFLLHEPFTFYTLTGLIVVMAALLYSERQRRQVAD